MSSEVDRRIYAGWRAFYKNIDILKSNVSMSRTRKLYNQCVVQVMSYASETGP